MIAKDTSLSWWEKNFAANLPAAQARMRAAALPPPVQAFFDQHLKREEAEMLCRKIPLRTPSPSITGRGTRSTDRTAGTDEEV